MNLKLTRLHSSLRMKKEVIQEDNEFLNEINDLLLDEDIAITEDADVDDMDVVFIETGGSEEHFVKIFNKLKAPIILLSTQKNNSLASCFEIKSYANDRDVPTILVYGDPKDCAEAITHFAKIYKAKQEINGARLGVIGKPSDWLIYSKVDYNEVQQKYGISLIDIDMDVFKKEIDKHQYSRVRHLDQLKEKWKKKPEVLEGALAIYGALKRIIIRYNLEGITVRCFDLLKEYKNTSCLAFALLNEEGYIAACEGDIPSMLTMFILSKLSGFSSFMCNVSTIDREKSQVLLAHCTCPLDMTSSYSLDTHFESGIGIGIKGELATGNISIFKLCADLKDFLAVPATLVKNESLNGYCRTQILVELDQRFFYQFNRQDFGNHVIVSYTDDPSEFASLIGLYNIINGDVD